MPVVYALDTSEIPQDRFIAFCFWHMNKFPIKIGLAVNWIIDEAFLQLRKYESTGNEIWIDVMNYVMQEDRGKRLMRLVEVRQDEPQEGGLKKLLEK